ncbi:MAG: VCBS repeat-containing protein [Deltaproteobacteria bacterium]|nr:VCBS repeat-containing protein [Deltaproteobacteria bacterium]
MRALRRIPTWSVLSLTALSAFAACGKSSERSAPAASSPAAGSATVAAAPRTASAPVAERVASACSGCHAMPPPGLLPKKVWRHEIDKMFTWAREIERPITAASREEVQAHYAAAAPEHLTVPAWRPAQPQPVALAGAATLVDPAPLRSIAGVSDLARLPGEPLRVAGGDMHSGAVFIATLTEPPTLQRVAKLRSVAHVAPCDLDRDGNLDLLVADLGIAQPTDEPVGAVAWLRGIAGGRFETLYLAQKIGRVTDARAVDLDGDGDLDVLVAEFGFRKRGALFWLENLAPGADGRPTRQKRHDLDRRAGALRVVPADFDGDGVLDIAAVFAQEHESVMLYRGKGAGRFEAETLWRAPHPNWGFNAMIGADLDGDGDLDLAVANGDSMDDNVPCKAHHGVAVLWNDGGRFRHQPLGALYGATGLSAADLDGDGDLDLAATTWFQPPEPSADVPPVPPPRVALFEQVGPGRFASRVLLPAHGPSLAGTPSVLLLPGRVVDGAFAFAAPPGGMPATLPLLHLHRLAPR